MDTHVNPPIALARKTVLAVLPFDNLSRDPDQEFFADGLTEEMIAQLGKLNRDRLTVIARSSVAKYKGSKLTAKEIGRELSADYLVQGSVRRSSDRVRITVQLIQAKNHIDLWTESYDRELRDVLAVQDSVVRSIASQIHIVLTGRAESGSRKLSAGTAGSVSGLSERSLLLEQANRREYPKSRTIVSAGD